MHKTLITAAAFAALATPALAQDAPEAPPAWTGEGSLTAGNTTGNTETTDFGVGLKLAHDGGKWRQSGELSADYGETDGEETRNRIFGALQVDRKFDGPRWSAYGRASHEIDEFSGFDNRTFLGAGLGYQALDSESTKWRLEGGPGYKIDKVASQTLADTPVVGETTIIPSTTEESFAFRAGSQFSHAFNESVTLTNDTSALYADVSTQFQNTIALNAKLWNDLSARLSYDVRHDTDPPLGVEQTDTATRFSLVYAFGG